MGAACSTLSVDRSSAAFKSRPAIMSCRLPTTADRSSPMGRACPATRRAIGSYLDQRCVAAYSDLDQVLTSLDVLNLANPTNAGPLAAAVGQLSPDRYSALPLIIGRQHTLILDAFGGRIDATRWPYADPQVNQHAIAPGAFAMGTRARGLRQARRQQHDARLPDHHGRRPRPGSATRTGRATCSASAAAICGAARHGATRREHGRHHHRRARRLRRHQLRPLLIDGALAGTYSFLDVNRRIVIPDAGLGIPGLSTAISRTANGKTEAPGLAARVDVGTNLSAYRIAVKPFVGLSYSWLEPARLHRDQCRQHQSDDGRQGQRRPAVAGRGRGLLRADGRRPVRLGLAGESGLDPPPVGHLGRYHGRAGGPAWKLHDRRPCRTTGTVSSPGWR